MYIDKDEFISVFRSMTEEASRPKLPLWHELPDIELYMDQVIFIITKYLSGDSCAEEKPITPSMVNNYVNLGTIPPPVRKKYSRLHLAYLFIVCTLKQTLDMATIQRIIPADTEPENIEHIYDSFVKNQNKAYDYITEKIESVATPIFEKESDNQDRLNDLLLQVASSANIFKLLTRKLSSCGEGEEK